MWRMRGGVQSGRPSRYPVPEITEEEVERAVSS